MHKDQNTVRQSIVPWLFDRSIASGEAIERDCTLLCRLLRQGPDPLFLMEVCPSGFEGLCDALGLGVQEGREAIELAHFRGPGALLAGKGVLFGYDPRNEECPPEWNKEFLWLILAGFSDCTEEGFGPDITVKDRLLKAFDGATNFMAMVNSSRFTPKEVKFRAVMVLREFMDRASFTWKDGIPISDKDEGFYVGYKRGFKCVGVQTPTCIFYGTTSDTTLSEQGIQVDKLISPSYGIKFNKKD